MSLEKDITGIKQLFEREISCAVIEICESFNSAKKRFVDTNKLSLEKLQYLSDMDKTSTKKYIEWLAKQATKPDLQYDMFAPENKTTIIDTLIKFEDLCTRNQVEDKQISSYSSFNSLHQLVQETPGISKSAIKKGIKDYQMIKKEDIFYQNDKVVIAEPPSKEMAIMYGRGSQWCTAAIGDKNRWQDYKDDKSIVYYMFDKHSNKKWGISKNQDGDVTFWEIGGDKMAQGVTNVLIDSLGIPKDMFSIPSVGVTFSNSKSKVYNIDSKSDIEELKKLFPMYAFVNSSVLINYRNNNNANLYLIVSKIDDNRYLLTRRVNLPGDSKSELYVVQDKNGKTVDYDTLIDKYKLPARSSY